MIFLFAIAIGFVAGLRSMTAPAVTCWAAHLKWIDLHGSKLGFLGSSAATYIFTALAIAELIGDKLPFIPSRLDKGPLSGRILMGGLSGAALCIASQAPVLAGIVLGALGGLAGAFAGFQARRRLVQNMKIPDFVVAVLEDIVAIGGAFLIVSRV